MSCLNCYGRNLNWKQSFPCLRKIHCVGVLSINLCVFFFLYLCVNANNEWPRSQAIDSESFKYLNNFIVNFPWSNHNNSPPAKLSSYSRGGTISMETIEKCFFINEIYTIVYHSNFDRRQYFFFPNQCKLKLIARFHLLSVSKYSFLISVPIFLRRWWIVEYCVDRFYIRSCLKSNNGLVEHQCIPCAFEIIMNWWSMWHIIVSSKFTKRGRGRENERKERQRTFRIEWKWINKCYKLHVNPHEVRRMMVTLLAMVSFMFALLWWFGQLPAHTLHEYVRHTIASQVINASIWRICWFWFYIYMYRRFHINREIFL